jgi:hypothetical protein
MAAYAASSATRPLSYRLYAATGREEAMIIALPGAAETPRMYCDGFSGGRYGRLARQRGYLLVCLSDYSISMRTETDERRWLPCAMNSWSGIRA